MQFTAKMWILFANKKIQNDITIQINPLLIMTVRTDLQV